MSLPENKKILIKKIKQIFDISDINFYYPHIKLLKKKKKRFILNDILYKLDDIDNKNLYNNNRQILVELFDSKLKKIIKKDIFVKKELILHPILYVKDSYKLNELLLPKNKYNLDYKKKISHLNNSTYIDSFFYCLASKLVEKNLCIHFPLFCGACNGISHFYYEATQEMSYLKYKTAFRKNKNLYELIKVNNIVQSKKYHVSSINKSDSTFTSSSESEESEYVEENNFNLNVDENESYESHISNENHLELNIKNIKINSCGNKFDLSNIVLEKSYKNKNHSCCNKSSTSSNSSDSSDYIGYKESYLKFKNVPSQFTFIENLDGTLEEVLEENINVDNYLLSCLFQICFTLSLVQRIFNFTHNDLHTRNIMYKNTNQKYLYYKINNKFYKVPTYNKIFKIIDFGRAIYTYNKHILFNDVYNKDGDASGQYTYPSEKRTKIVKPNYSFDLSRLAVSIFEDCNTTLNFTLKNLLKKWHTDNKNRDIRRYKEFDLYKAIARKINNAIPKDQLTNPIFNKYLIEKNEIHRKCKIYDLNCKFYE